MISFSLERNTSSSYSQILSLNALYIACVHIATFVPMYPMSKDEVNYERLIKILSLYRLTLGQARQEELLEYLFKEFKETSGLKKLFIDLSPFSKGKEG